MPTKPMTQNEALRAVYNHPSLPAELHEICREVLVAAYDPATEPAAIQPAGKTVAWANVKEDGSICGLSQHPEDITSWKNPRPLSFAAPISEDTASVGNSSAAPSDEGGAV